MPRLNPLEYVRSGLTEGLSARAAYRQMREDAQRLSEETGQRWTGIRLYTFQQMYTSTMRAREDVKLAINAPKDVPGGGLTITSRPSTVAGGYLHAGVAFTRPVGGGELDRTVHLFRAAELLTPADVEEMIRRQIEESAQQTHGTFNRTTIEGITYTGAQELTGKLY